MPARLFNGGRTCGEEKGTEEEVGGHSSRIGGLGSPSESGRSSADMARKLSDAAVSMVDATIVTPPTATPGEAVGNDRLGQ